VLPWARRHVPEALLIPAGASALTVTALSDIDEVAPWGHEFGIGVSQLAFAYIGAYIFHRLIVVRPRERQMRQYYEASQGLLFGFALFPQHSVSVIFDVQYDSPNMLDGGSTEALQPLFASLRKLPAEYVERTLSGLYEAHEAQYAGLAPLLGFFDPEVSVKVAALHAATFPGLAEYYSRNLMNLDAGWTQSQLADALVKYQKAGKALGEELLRAELMPEPSNQVRARLKYSGLEQAGPLYTPN
jgi:hypothetical protein